jgi:formamidopyrimidine-DNA glycosylase
VPELPEVEVVRRGADHWFTGREIHGVEVLHPRSIRRHLAGEAAFRGQLLHTKIETTDRRGKFFWFNLSTGNQLVVHLGMSGQVLVNAPQDPAQRHLRIRISFADSGRECRFVDQRTFGGAFVDSPTGVRNVPESVAHIALDPFDPEFDQIATARKMQRSTSAVKSVLLNQSVVSGVGNIYADEALWRSKLNWATPASALSIPRLRALLQDSAAVMAEALAAGGTSFDALYVNVNGSSGYFGRSLAAYGRAGKPCPRCGSEIVREAFANRSSFRCNNCQRSNG